MPTRCSTRSITTKSVAKRYRRHHERHGTGVLSISYGIVQSFGGKFPRLQILTAGRAMFSVTLDKRRYG